MIIDLTAKKGLQDGHRARALSTALGNKSTYTSNEELQAD